MKQILNKILPERVIELLRFVKQQVWDKNYRNFLVKKMTRKHHFFLKSIQEKKRLKVVFLAIHDSTWKADTVFREMLKNPLFEPIILVCPFTKNGDIEMFSVLENSLSFFRKKGYPYISSYDKNSQTWVKLSNIKPDIVFFTNPHNLTFPEYYENAYLNYLSCYIPYHHEVGSYGNDIAQYGNNFQASLWLFFLAHNSSKEQFLQHFPQKGQSAKVVGYPAMSELLKNIKSCNFKDSWKTNDGRIRLIWAPHHSIDMDKVLPYSTFLLYAEKMIELAEKYKEQIIWSFKPHPLLKAKLYLHPNWGKEKTDAFYDFWESQEYTQINLSEYWDLFITSDAMIHDCGSFLAEYLYTKKPVLYLLSPNNNGNQHYNSFGQKALRACEIGSELKDIDLFLQKIQKSLTVENNHKSFLDSEIIPFFKKSFPEEKIIQIIQKEIKNAK